MNKYFFCLFSLMISWHLEGLSQMVAEDAKGQSSILVKNSSISFNLTEAQLSAAINNFRRIHVAEKPRQFLWQLEASGKNEEGLSTLWNDGNLQAASRLNGFLGVRLRGSRMEYRLFDELTRLSGHAALVAYRNALDYTNAMKTQINADVTLNAGQKNDLINALNAISKNQNYNLASVIADAGQLAATYGAANKGVLQTATNSIIIFLAARKATADGLKPAADAIRNQIKDVNRQIDDFRSTHPMRAWTIFFNFGMNASSYTLYSRPLGLPFSNRFDTTNFRGGFAGIGVNYDAGARWTFGLEVDYEKANTFDTLAKKEYVERTAETNTPQTLTSEKKYSAYSGLYDVYDRATIKTDILCFGKLDDNFRYVWNTLYSRFFLPINADHIQPIIFLGTSINFYKQNGKFVGGVYLEERDVANRLKDSDSNFWKRLRLGITTKFAFQSIFDRQ